MKHKQLPFLVMCAAVLFTASTLVAADKATGTANQNQNKDAKTVKTASGLQYEVLKEGNGASPKTGDRVQVHYVGTFTDGKKFDSSRDGGNKPFVFTIGLGQVIPGWDEGVATMKIGETRKLIVPPELGYGPRGTPDGAIPPNSTLIFEVELLGINP